MHVLKCNAREAGLFGHFNGIVEIVFAKRVGGKTEFEFCFSEFCVSGKTARGMDTIVLATTTLQTIGIA